MNKRVCQNDSIRKRPSQEQQILIVVKFSVSVAVSKILYGEKSVFGVLWIQSRLGVRPDGNPRVYCSRKSVAF